MTDCEPIVKRLVAYADGELPAAESEEVAGHVTQCVECQAELRRLERSLELARGVWETASIAVEWAERSESHQEPDAEPQSRPTARIPGLSLARERGRMLRLAYAAAAAVLVAIGAWWIAERGGQTVVQTPGTPVTDVEQIISRAERAARLKASMEILASQPGLEKYYAEAKQYYERHYGPGSDQGTNDSLMN